MKIQKRESRLKYYRVCKRFSLSKFKFVYLIQQCVRKYFQDGLDTYFADVWEDRQVIDKSKYYELKRFRNNIDYQEVLGLNCITKERKILNETKER